MPKVKNTTWQSGTFYRPGRKKKELQKEKMRGNLESFFVPTQNSACTSSVLSEALESFTIPNVGSSVQSTVPSPSTNTLKSGTKTTDQIPSEDPGESPEIICSFAAKMLVQRTNAGKRF